ncbi:MAG: hypothetical protein D6796_01690 [Caldilineae bacterium]|nr:MAG: hypothetical protein D6796_01690 [Caldilineae bacterium]
MSNTLSPTEKPRTFIEFKRGDIVNARGQIGVVVDVLTSAETDNICLYVRFVHNLGNARPYDVLEISSGRMLGVDKWTLATQKDLEQAITRRKARLEKEIEELLRMATGQNGRLHSHR